MKKVACLLSVFGLLLLTLFSGCIGNDYSSVEIVENSPYPEFIYVNKDMLKVVTNKTSEHQTPDYFFVIFNGAYIDKNNYSKIAVKTPLWRFGSLFADENIKTKNGMIFLNSDYVQKPDLKYNKPLNYNDVIVYNKNYGIFIEIGEEHNYAELITENLNENRYLMENIGDIAGKNIINRTIIENDDLLLGTYVLENGIPVGDINNSLFKMNITSTS
ncbi:hypothetical protein [Methanococcus maripaludis]|uniref:Uncharacterized protein n=1 Tax=Methanococcus maripaludis TaxID=39152 RepID=A0A8T4H5M8_METMI|nr:hypothetical protein [Methanococcus maripaludis]MBM7409266.1 hypothetical protein [Methanococcus maripaludis]MBP2218548.1 hypothetical protein [Methanococcus maripaludis]